MLQVADEEAQRLKDQFISVEHLLVAAGREDAGDSARLFRELGVNQEMVYQAMQKLPGARTGWRTRTRSRSIAPWRSTAWT